MNDIVNIHSQFGTYLFNFIRKKVGAGEVAEDIYQELILKILNKQDQLNSRESLKSWLFTIAKNQIIDYYRKQKQFTDIDTLELEFEDQPEAGNYGELEGCLSNFIAQLPDDYRQVITLSELEGKTQKELSELLGVNYVTIRSKVQRGRERIRKLILEACAIEQDKHGRPVDCTPKNHPSSCSSADSACGCGA